MLTYHWLPLYLATLQRVTGQDLSATCIKRNVLYYTSSSTTFTLSELATSTVSSCPVPSSSAPATTAQSTVTQTIYSPCATSASIGNFNSGNISAQQSLSDSSCAAGKVVSSDGAISPYDGSDYLLITFDGASCNTAGRRRQTASVDAAEFNVTQTFTTIGGVGYTVGGMARDAPSSGTSPNCTLMICVDDVCGELDTLTTNWALYSFDTAVLLAGNTTAIFAFVCTGQAYVGLDDISAVADGLGASSSAAPGMQTITSTVMGTTTLFATQTQYVTLNASTTELFGTTTAFVTPSPVVFTSTLAASTTTIFTAGPLVTQTIDRSITGPTNTAYLNQTWTPDPVTSLVPTTILQTSLVPVTIVSTYVVTQVTSLPGSTIYETSLAITTLLQSHAITATEPGPTVFLTTTQLSSYPITFTSVQPGSTVTTTALSETTIVSYQSITYTTVQVQTINNTLVSISSYPITETTSLPAYTLTATATESTLSISSYAITETDTLPAYTFTATTTESTLLISSYAITETTSLPPSTLVATETNTATTTEITSLLETTTHPASTETDTATTTEVSTLLATTSLPAATVTASSDCTLFLQDMTLGLIVAMGDDPLQYAAPAAEAGDQMSLRCLQNSPAKNAGPVLDVHLLNCPQVDANTNGPVHPYYSDFTITQDVGSPVEMDAGGSLGVWVLPPNVLTANSPGKYFQYTMTPDAQQSIAVSCFTADLTQIQWAYQCPSSLVITVYDSTLGVRLGSSGDYSSADGPPWIGDIFSFYSAAGHNITTIVEADSSTQLEFQVTGTQPYPLGAAYTTLESGIGSVSYSFMRQGDRQALSILCSPASPPPPSRSSLCTSVPWLGIYDQYGDYIVYLIYFSGTGVTESLENPGNGDPNNPPQFYELDGSLSDCDAINTCLQLYQAALYGGFGNWYSAVDLHYRISTNKWECVKFYGRVGGEKNQRTSYFDQASDDIGNVYGYSTRDIEDSCCSVAQ
ncbi:hypothetical protein LTR56_011102 [Elasticomyces elasticus]|nr:hypothetical protein LTR56_011102 [Elasticomyces elasticus]KAK3662477.1 hypothetical protein LTR22_006756 [Elasticomyces elasticus]KAK4926466.1 hypothetical protein LTR49_006673 [Elasticomyces elasticus]KAK5761160.1 hypothetical protein LTS12_008641 [Elasticomyces elasticus]